LILITYSTSYDIMLLVHFINVRADRDKPGHEPVGEVDQDNNVTITDSHPPQSGQGFGSAEWLMGMFSEFLVSCKIHSP